MEIVKAEIKEGFTLSIEANETELFNGKRNYSVNTVLPMNHVVILQLAVSILKKISGTDNILQMMIDQETRELIHKVIEKLEPKTVMKK